MSEPQFIPSGVPHSVEMPEGSHVAKSKSGKAGTEVRRTEQDHFAQDQEIAVDANQIHLWLLSGQLHASRLSVEAKHLALWICRFEFIFHDSRPNPTSCTELGNLFQNCGSGNKEES